MTSLLPISSSCHALQLPPTEKDDRLNLNVRTGSASTLYNSLIFVSGGLTIGLDIHETTIAEILAQFVSKLTNSKSQNLHKYLSGEVFYLNLIERSWVRAVVQDGPSPPPRLYHEIAAANNCIYVFGGLVINPWYSLNDSSSIPDDLLIPANDLWEFNLESSKWTLLDSGRSENSPAPRFCHKMTSINSLKFVNKKDHFGLFIAGGKNAQSDPIYDNAIFDLVEKKYVGASNYKLNLAASTPTAITKALDVNNVESTDDNYNINVTYTNSFIVNFSDSFSHFNQPKPSQSSTQLNKDEKVEPELSKSGESLIVYTPVKNPDKSSNPLVSFGLGKSIKNGKVLPIHRKEGVDHIDVVPYNLRYPTVGLFGQNLVITGFLANDYDISVFIFNKPTGKWSRLNVFCNHDYGSHRFWGGYTWRSHHKVVLIGNYVTSRTTSSIRYFTCLITISLPVANILASSELAGGGHYHDAAGNRIYFDELNRTTDDSTDSLSVDKSSSDTERPIMIEKHPNSRRPSYASRGSRGSVATAKSPKAISFSEYVHYAAPTTNFTTIRSVFPPAAITLGRNFLDRFGDLTSDFEIISVHGDRIPVSLMVLTERWGRYFIELLARGYVNAVEKFEKLQKGEVDTKLFSKSSSTSSSGKNVNILKSSFTSSHASSVSSEVSDKPTKKEDIEDPKDRTYHITMPQPPKKPKEAPQFRLPFQETSSKVSLNDSDSLSVAPDAKTPTLMSTSASEGSQSSQLSQIGPKTIDTSRKDSIGSFGSGHSLLTSHLQDIPPQLPLPNEPIPAVPTNQSFRSSSRRGSNDLSSPRGSLISTLTALRNIPLAKSPRGSPFASPRASISQQGGLMPPPTDLSSSPVPHLKYVPSPDSTRRRLENFTGAGDEGELGPHELPVDPFGANIKQVKSSSSSSSLSDPLTNQDISLSLPDHSGIDAKVEEQEEKKDTTNDNFFDNILLNFENLENGTFQMESSLIPRKLYFPYGSSSVKAFCEYLYTGQIGNKWLLTPTTLDNLCIAKYFKVPLLYDLISEVLYGVIGRREAWVVKRANELKKIYYKLLDDTQTPHDPSFVFPLDEYEGFMDTIDDGYLDIALLRRTTRLSKGASIISERRKRSEVSSYSERRRSASNLPEDNAFGGYESGKESDGKEEVVKVESGDTDDTSDKTGSSDDDQQFHYTYMTTNTEPLNVGPRSKSVFDRSEMDVPISKADDELDDSQNPNHFENLTLEQLVSPQSPIPCEGTMDIIYESVCFVGDLKLMLRASNAKNMGRILKEFELELEEKMDAIKERYDADQRQPFPPQPRPVQHAASSSNLSQVLTQQMSRVPQLVKNHSFDGEGAPVRNISLKPVGSSSSLSLSFSDSNAPDNAPIERTKSNSSFRALSGLSSFKSIKPEPRGTLKHSNSDDIQTVTSKKDLKKEAPAVSAKEMVAAAKKEEKQKRKEAQKQNKELRRAKTSVTLGEYGKGSDQISLRSIDSESKKKHHGFFHSIGSHLKTRGSETSLEVGQKLTRSESPTSITSNTSKTSESAKAVPTNLFGIKRHN